MTATRALPRVGSDAAGLAFLGVTVLGGVNAVAVRIANAEIAPLWGATLRFALAGWVLLGAVVITRTPLPRGRALTGSILYGAVGFAGAFGCIHWALASAPPASVQTMLALVPMLTYLSAVGIGLERFRSGALVGAVVAFGGVALIVGDGLRAATPLIALAAAAAGAACMAGSNIVAKSFPRSHPVASNAVAMMVGAAILLLASLLTGEVRALPSDGPTWGAVAYVSLAGTAAVFSLFAYVLQRWTASASSYVMLLMPLVTVVVASVVIGQPPTPIFAAGGGLVLAGVALGIRGPRQTGGSDEPVQRGSTGGSRQPGCA